MKRLSALAGILCFLVLAQPAVAIAIYDETIDGDLDAVGSTNVNLVLGANEIIGSINATPQGDTDRIKFTQTTGLLVDSIELSFAPPFDDFNIGQNMTTALFNNAANLFDDNFNNVGSGASILASFFDSFGPETGPLSQNTDGAVWDFQLSPGVVFPAQPWTLTILTSSSNTGGPTDVPEPGVLFLFGLGLAGLGLSRKKR